jgi:hypothetical protein
MWLYDGLNLLHDMTPITELIEGGARGADWVARNWALWRQGCGDRITLTTVNAEWEKHGRSAGAIRNIEMAKLEPDIVVACPGGRGTEHMVMVARGRGLRVVFLEKMPVHKRGAPKDPPVVIIDAAA